MMLRRSRGVFLTSSAALLLSSGWLLCYLGPAMLCDVDRVLEGPCEPWEAQWCHDSDSMKLSEHASFARRAECRWSAERQLLPRAAR